MVDGWVNVKFSYNWLCIYKALGNFQNSDNNNKNKNNDGNAQKLITI